MKQKYIIQLKRYKLWEDLITYYDKKTTLVVYHKLKNEGFNVRYVEVFYI